MDNFQVGKNWADVTANIVTPCTLKIRKVGERIRVFTGATKPLETDDVGIIYSAADEIKINSIKAGVSIFMKNLDAEKENEIVEISGVDFSDGGAGSGSGAGVISVNNRAGAVTLNKADVGIAIANPNFVLAMDSTLLTGTKTVSAGDEATEFIFNTKVFDNPDLFETNNKEITFKKDGFYSMELSLIATNSVSSGLQGLWIYALFSDDNGATWKRADFVSPRVSSTSANEAEKFNALLLGRSISAGTKIILMLKSHSTSNWTIENQSTQVVDRANANNLIPETITAFGCYLGITEQSDLFDV